MRNEVIDELFKCVLLIGRHLTDSVGGERGERGSEESSIQASPADTGS